MVCTVVVLLPLCAWLSFARCTTSGHHGPLIKRYLLGIDYWLLLGSIVLRGTIVNWAKYCCSSSSIIPLVVKKAKYTKYQYRFLFISYSSSRSYLVFNMVARNSYPQYDPIAGYVCSLSAGLQFRQDASVQHLAYLYNMYTAVVRLMGVRPTILLELQSRFGDTPLKFQVVCP